MIMTNSDEGALWAWPMPVDQYKKYVEQTFEKFAPEVMKLYPGNNTDETYTSYGDSGCLQIGIHLSCYQ